MAQGAPGTESSAAGPFPFALQLAGASAERRVRKDSTTLGSRCVPDSDREVLDHLRGAANPCDRAVGAQRIPDVHGGEDPRRERDLLALSPRG